MRTVDELLDAFYCPKDPKAIVRLARSLHRIGMRKRNTKNGFFVCQGLDHCRDARDLVTFARELRNRARLDTVPSLEGRLVELDRAGWTVFRSRAFGGWIYAPAADITDGDAAMARGPFPNFPAAVHAAFADLVSRRQLRVA